MTTTKSTTSTSRKKSTDTTTKRKSSPKKKEIVFDDIFESNTDSTQDFLNSTDRIIDVEQLDDNLALGEIASNISNLETTQTDTKTGTIFTAPIDGGYNISKKVLAQIALLAAHEVKGLAPQKQDLLTKVQNLVQGRTCGIKIDMGSSEAAVDILVRVQYGTDIPKFSQSLRNVISKRIYEMTGLRVVEANIRIQDVTPAIPESTDL